MIAAIIGVADAFAMISDRPIAKLTRAGRRGDQENILKQFHPKPAQAFLELLRRGRFKRHFFVSLRRQFDLKVVPHPGFCSH